MCDELISVIIPVYNVAPYLTRCLDSVVGQTYNKIEIICINDGSTDNSGKILDDYAKKDSRIKVIHQENFGLSVARNVGLNIAAGEAVSFVDSDDWIAPDFYERLMAEMQTRDVDVVQCGYYQVKNNCKKEVLCKDGEFKNFEEVLSNLRKCYVWNKLWKKDFLDKNNLRFEQNVYYEDILFTVLAAVNIKKWKQINYAGYFYCDNPTSVTRDPKKEAKRSNDRFIVNSKSLAYAKEKNIENTDMLVKFLIRHLVDVNELADKEIYEKYKILFSNHQALQKRRRKALMRKIFSFSLKRKRLRILGKNFWN